MGFLQNITQNLSETVNRWDIGGGRRKAREGAQREATFADISKQIQGISEYEISPEATQRMELLEQTGESMVEGAEEATDIARSKVGMTEAFGAGQARRDIEATTAQQTQTAQQLGGPGFLGAISKIGLGEEQAYEDLAISGMQQQRQSESALMGALQTEAGIKTQAAGMEAQALEGMAAEKEKVFQSQLSKAQTGLQFDISKLAMDEQSRIAKRNKPKILGLF